MIQRPGSGIAGICTDMWPAPRQSRSFVQVLSSGWRTEDCGWCGSLPGPMGSHVPAVRLPPDHASGFMAAAVPARGDVEDRRDLDSAPPARGPAATPAAAPEPELGGPGPDRGPAQRDTQSAPPRNAAAGHTRHDPALAPRPHPPPLGGPVQARQDRPTGDPPERQGPGPPAGPGEPRMGLPQDPRRAGRPGSESSGVDGVGNPEERRNRPGAAADRAYLATVPAFSG